MGLPARRPRGAAGFTLVELLITIVLAGIVFAAMAPLFIGAQEVSAMDQMRNIALNLAQDRVEKVRALDYDDLTVANLQSSSFAGGQFGTTWTAYNGSAARPFTIAYTVTDMGGETSSYKKVTVTVTWTAPPVVKPVQLQTMVSKAYAGPTIANMQLTPLDANGAIYSSPLTLRATVATADIASTTKVKFYIYDQAGQEIQQTDATTGVGGVYTITWDCSAAQNGLYSFRAQAYAGEEVGNTWRRGAELLLDNPPPAPANLHADAGDALVALGWDPVVIGDFSHYELWRGTAAGAETLYQDDLSANAYTDSGLTNGTTYYYKVRAVDTEDHAGAFSSEVSATPVSQTDVTPPNTPGSFNAVANMNKAVLTWTAPTDPGTPSTGVQGFYIYRTDTPGIFATVGPSTTSFEDVIGFSTTKTYSVKAFDGVGLLSAATASKTVTTGTQPKYTVTVWVKNSSGAGLNGVPVRLYSTATGFDQNGTTSGSGSNKGKKAFSNVPWGGPYTCTATYNAVTKTQTVDLLSANTTLNFVY
jgi:prepilin-type N-terminal cleavage/methylation domain-containing protein